MIYVIGDSHARSYRQGIPILTEKLEGDSGNGIGWFEVGPATAYNLIKDNSTVQAKKKIKAFIDKHGLQEKYVFVFGEIDCRLHVFDHYVRNGQISMIEDYVTATVERYLLFLHHMKNYGVNFAVMTIPPTSLIQNTFHYKNWAAVDLRAKIHAMFNSALKAACRVNGFQVIDFYGKVADEQGHALEGTTSDGCHLHTHVATPLLVKELKRIGWMENGT